MDERTTEISDEGLERFVLSPALVDQFLPQRRDLLARFLAESEPEAASQTATFGGGETH